MSCPNFTTQKDFNLYLWDFEMSDETLDEIVKQYADDFDMDIEDVDRDEIYNDYEELEYKDIIDQFDSVLSTILTTYNRKLKYLKPVLKYGYYGGLQFYVERQTDDSNIRGLFSDTYDDMEQLFSCLSNEDTKYWIDTCLSVFKREYKSEVNFLNKKVLPKLAKYFGFEEYYCMGIFSNGEAIYSKVA